MNDNHVLHEEID